LAAAALDHEALRVVHRVLFSRLEERVQATLERTLELAIDRLQLADQPERMCGQLMPQDVWRRQNCSIGLPDTSDMSIDAELRDALQSGEVEFTLGVRIRLLNGPAACHLNQESIVGSRRMFHAGLVGTAVTRPPSTMNSLPVE
jgi:hypothetical protein